MHDGAGEPLTIDDGSFPLKERGREIIAERLGWPQDALSALREIEARYPLWYCWWTSFPYPAPGFSPAYGARPIDGPTDSPVIYARAADELGRLIGERESRGRDG